MFQKTTPISFWTSIIVPIFYLLLVQLMLTKILNQSIQKARSIEMKEQILELIPIFTWF
jgi:hypothetical protein